MSEDTNGEKLPKSCFFCKYLNKDNVAYCKLDRNNDFSMWFMITERQSWCPLENTKTK